MLAVAGQSGPYDVAAQVTSIVRVDNPSLDVRMARVGTSWDDPDGLPAVLASAANMRPTDGPAAIVVPLLALPFPAVTEAIRYAVAQSNVNAYIAEPFNVNLTFAEALHIRLAGCAPRAGRPGSHVQHSHRGRWHHRGHGRR